MKKTQESADSFLETYKGHANTLRTWFIAYGIGLPVLVLSNESLWELLKKTSSILLVGVVFLAGVFLQVLLAALNKTVMWYCYWGEEEVSVKKTRWYKFFSWFSDKYWIDFLVDISTLCFFVWGTCLVFNAILKS